MLVLHLDRRLVLVLILAVLSRVACVFTPSSFLARTPQPVCLFFKFVFFSASTGTSLGRLVFQIERKRRGRTLYVPSFLRSHSGHCVFCGFVDYSSKKLLLSFSPAEATLFLVWILFAVGNTPYGKWHSSRAEPPL